MRVSLAWLKEYVKVDIATEKLVELLDMSGTKVESVRSPNRAVRGVVVGEVQAVEQHPNADNLMLVQVTDGDAQARVVCGARNYVVGDKVPFARVGAALGDLEISERKLRGEMSAGMLCSGSELGVSRDHSGILILPPDAELGQDVVPLLGLDDTILELELTPNRPDCMSMVGIAREVAALTGEELHLPAVDVEGDQDVTMPVRVDIEDQVGCPRYLARYITGVTIGPSPSWIATRLLASGVRPISNVVDATNYVMLELGQPLHAFDARHVTGAHIIVKRARDGEVFTTLDGVERKMSSEDLMIADPKRSLAMAGAMGGADSEVSPDTTEIILESAYFSPRAVALTSRRHLLRTEASARFERGADPNGVARAASKAARLIQELAGGRVAAAVVDAYPAPIEPREVYLRPSRTTAVLGLDLSASQQADHLRSIGLEVVEEGASLRTSVPTFRPDLEREADLIEEVARLAGYDRLPSTLPPGRTGGLEAEQIFERNARRTFAGLGVHEAWTSSFMSPNDLDALGLDASHAARSLVYLSNPTSEEEPVLRTSMLPGLLRSVARNFSHRAAGSALFEIGRIYENVGETLPREASILAGAFSGEMSPKRWNGAPVAWDLFAVKGTLTAGLKSLHLPTPTFKVAAGMPFHPTRAASVAIGDAIVGAVGEIHPDVCARFDVPEGTVAFELGFAALVNAREVGGTTPPLPRFPGLFIDLAVVLDEGIPASSVTTVVEEAGAPEVDSVRLFDLYKGPQIGEGKKSLAFALEIRSPDRTMTDEEAAIVRDRIMLALETRFGAELRT